MSAITHKQLIFRRMTLDDAERLKDFYAAYETSFPDENERETYERMMWLLAINDNCHIQRRFGPYQEFALALCDESSNEIVGGLWFGVVSSPEHRACGLAASVQIYYLFLYKHARPRLPPPTTIVAEIQRYALAAFPPAPGDAPGDVAFFFEANNPADMLPEDIDADRDNSETDPYRRFSNWLYYARPLNFDYVQPALDRSKQPVRHLTMFYRGPGTSVDRAMLLVHLRVYISISVLKGQPADEDPAFQEMAGKLGQIQRVGFIPDDNDTIKDIRERAKQQRQREQVAAKSSPWLSVPTLPSSRPHMVWLPRLYNRLYRIVYQGYHWLEHYHLRVATAETVVGGVALLVSFVASFLAVATWVEGLVSNSALISMIVAFIRRQTVSWRLEDFDHWVILFLSLYIGSRGVVVLRRNRLGHRFDSVSRRVRDLDDGTGAAAIRITNELKQLFGQRAAQRQSFGPMIATRMSEQERDAVLVQIAGLSAEMYSDQVWRVADRAWQQWESNALARWLHEFPDGLVGATYPTCPGRVFCSLVLPVLTPARLSRLDLREIEIDRRYVRRLSSGSEVPIPQRDRLQGPPTLLVLRLLMTRRSPQGRRMPPFESQVGLLVTGLLHLALLLGRLASAGDLIKGLPENTTILVVAANRQSAEVLHWFGFKLLQRPAPHDEMGAADLPGEANLGLYRLIIAKSSERTIEERRFLDILQDLLGVIGSGAQMRH